MLLAIIADSHDNLATLDKAAAYCRGHHVEFVIHCGDVCTVDTMRELLQRFDLPIHLCYGNGDYDKAGFEKLKTNNSKLILYGDFGTLTLDDKKIAWCHYPQQARTLAMTKNYNAVFYGHTHQPWEEKIGPTMVRNPGTLAGLWSKATFTVYDTATNTAQLILIERL